MRISFFGPCASAGLPSPARAVATTVPARNSRREEPDLLCLLMIGFHYVLMLEIRDRFPDCLSRLSWAVPIDQLVGRANAGYFSLPSAILAGHTVTCLPSCH